KRDDWVKAYHECDIKLVSVDKENELIFYKSFYEMNFKPYEKDTLENFLQFEGVEFTADENDWLITKQLREAYNNYIIDEEGGQNQVSPRAFVPKLRTKTQGKYFDTGVKTVNGKTVNIIKVIKRQNAPRAEF